MPLTSVHDLLAPVGWASFVAASWQQRPLHIPGPECRARDLPSWPELNGALETHRIGRNSVLVGYHERVEVVQSRRDGRGHEVPDLDVPALYRALRDGKSLVLFGVDASFPAVGRLADGLSRHFGVAVEANLFAGFGDSVSFGAHRDDEDQFIVQVSGRKRWQLLGTTADAVAPTAVIEDVVLEPGAVLYVPRGHWHDVTSLGEPALHITFQLARARGDDLLAWLTTELCAADRSLRMDLPRLASPDERRAHVARLRDAVRAAWTDDVLERYVARAAAGLGARPRVNLPAAALGDGLPDGDDFMVASNLRARPALVVADDEVVFAALGREWRLDGGFAPLVRRLLCDGPCRLRDLGPAAPAVAPDDARALVAELFTEGLVFVIP